MDKWNGNSPKMKKDKSLGRKEMVNNEQFVFFGLNKIKNSFSCFYMNSVS